MPKPSGSLRPLPYPLNYSADRESSVTGEDPTFQTLENWPTEDPDENVRVVMDLSLNDYVALASSIDVGSDIAYGDNSIEIWWIWVRILASMSICDDVADCIENSTAVQAALAAWQGQRTQAQATSAMDAQRSDDMAGGIGSGCNPDAWWTGSLSLVQRLNRANEDILQQIESSTNVIDFASQVIGDVTGVDETSADAVLGWIEFLIDNIAENYLAQYTVAYEEEVACDLFCLALENCSLSAEQLFDYFLERVGSGLSWNSLITDVLGYLVGRSWSGTQIVDFFMLSQIAARRFFAQFTPSFIAFYDIQNSIRIGLNSPDSDWDIICDDCPEIWSWTQNIVDDGIGVWTGIPGESSGEYVASVGWRGTLESTTPSNEWRAGLETEFTAANVTRIEMQGFFYPRTNPGTQASIIGFFDSSLVDRLDVNPGTGEFNVVLDLGAGEILDMIRLRDISTQSSPRPVITQTIVTGTGEKPPEFP